MVSFKSEQRNKDKEFEIGNAILKLELMSPRVQYNNEKYEFLHNKVLIIR
jgi:hypothetical protein